MTKTDRLATSDTERNTDETRLKLASPFVSINGIPLSNGDLTLASRMSATISIWDTSFHRGDGVFEVMRLLPKGGEIRALENHLTRLETSANAVQCPLPSREILRTWLQQASVAAMESKVDSGGEEASAGCLRLIATKGGGVPAIHHPDVVPPSVIISWFPLPKWPATFTLCPILAPWHCAGAPGWETPIKWTSYGPNVLSTQKAKAQGFTDALLLSSLRLSNSWTPKIEECHVLDGPNFAIAWIRNHTLHVPDAFALGLLPSITQDLVQTLAREKLGIHVEHGIYTLQDVLDADEVYITSTTRGIIPVTAIGSHIYDPSPKNSYVYQLQTILAQHYGEGVE